MQTTLPPTSTPIVEETWHFKEHAPEDPPAEDWTRPGWQGPAAWIIGSLAIVLLFLEFTFLVIHTGRAPTPEATTSARLSH